MTAQVTDAQRRALAAVEAGKVTVIHAPHDESSSYSYPATALPRSLAACENRGWIAEDRDRAEPIIAWPGARRVPVVLTDAGREVIS